MKNSFQTYQRQLSRHHFFAALGTIALTLSMLLLFLMMVFIHQEARKVQQQDIVRQEQVYR